MCCHTEIEVVDQSFYLTRSQYTDTQPASPRADFTMPGVTGMTQPRKGSMAKAGIEPRSATLEADTLLRGQRGSLLTRGQKAASVIILANPILISQSLMGVNSPGFFFLTLRENSIES